MAIQSYRDLDVWQQAVDFVVDIYAVTKVFPREEAYGLTAQLRRAAAGIPCHISEGHRRGINAYAHFITIALGSLAEVETQLEIARRLHLAPEPHIASLEETATHLGRLLHGLRRALKRRQSLIPNP